MATHMLDNWDKLSDEENIPNNTIELGPPPDGVKDIIRGTTPEHFLHVPFNIKKDINQLIITYKQNTVACINKTLDDVRVYSDGDSDVVYYQFTEEETKMFKAIPNEPCLVQMRAELRNHDVVASDICKIHILDVLNDEVLING